MSAILFNTPVAAPPPNASQTVSSGTAVAEVPAAQAAGAGKDASLSGGDSTGSELANQAETAALFRKRQSLERPSAAASGSIVQAQADEQKADLRVGPDLPKVDPPDPLPTAPVLLRMREVG